MRKHLLVVAMAIAIVGLAPSLAPARSHRGHQASGDRSFTLHVTILNADVTTNPSTTSGPPPSGELLLIGGSGTFTGGGDGHVYFTIASVSKDTGVLDAVLAFKDGTITVQGLSTAATGDTEHYAITGGTGKYRGARGEVTLSSEKLTSDGETFDLDIALTH